jgi:hypothetical protein
MKITIYGIFTALGIIAASSILHNLTVKEYFILFLCFLFFIFGQQLWCSICSTSYSFASFLTIFPLLVSLFFDCNHIFKIILALALFAAIGRIGCLFAGCCTGKVSEASPIALNYKNDHVVNKTLNNSNVHVYPTILIEIISQFIIVYLVYRNKFGVVLFGILNALLLWATSFWRLSDRLNNIYFPIVSMFVFSFIVYHKKCFNHPHLTFVLQPIGVIIAIVFGLMASNDIQIYAPNK